MCHRVHFSHIEELAKESISRLAEWLLSMFRENYCVKVTALVSQRCL
jgi:hypothetical protein